MRFSSIIPRTLAAVLLTLAVAHHAAGAPSPAAAGWEKLWQNRNAEARTQFRQALQQRPGDPAALRGLGLLSYQEDASLPALQAWQPLYRLTPGHWTLTAYWPRMVELARHTGRWGLLEQAARDLLASSKTAPELRASAVLTLAEAAERAGKEPEAARLRTSLGYVTRWRIIGPFDNVSLSGFDKPFPPEREVDFSRTYSGKDDQSLRWHPLSLVSRGGQCAVGASLGDGGANVFYMATALQSPREQPVVFRCDPTGATKIYLNGRLVHSDDQYRQRVPLVADPIRVPATLRKGWNSVLVKLADDEWSNVAFALRITAPDGVDPAVTTADPDKASLAGVEPATAAHDPAATARVQSAAVDLIRAAAPASDLEAAAAIAHYQRLARDHEGAVTTLKAALAKAPGCGWLRWELSQSFQADQQTDEAAAEREQALKLNPRLVAAELEEMGDREKGLSLAQRLQRLKALRKSHPQSARLLWALAGAYSEADLNAESIKASREAVALAAGPEQIERLVTTYLIHGRKAEMQRLLAQTLQTTPNSVSLLQWRARQLSGAGNTAATIALYQRLLKLDPASASYHVELADLHQNARNLKAAVQSLRQARRQRPQDANLCMRLADLLREMGQSKEAISLYRAAVQLEPSQVSRREKLQLLTGERPVIDLVPPTPVGPILKAAPKSLPGASSLTLLDETRQVVYSDYANVTRARLIIKVFDASAVERYQQFPLPGGSMSETVAVESAKIIKPDGKVQNAGEFADGTQVSLPSLAPGDIIDISYRVDEYPRGGLARQFWAQWHFNDRLAPVKLSRYVLITPPNMAMQFRRHNGAPEPAVRDLKGWRVREWKMTDLPAPKPEPATPGPTEMGIWLDISTITSWRQIVDWYRDLSRPRCIPDAALRAKALELTRDAKTPEAKLEALVRFVAREIQYQTTPFRNSAYVPTLGRQVLRERYGDCKDKAALLTAMLAAVGIKSNMVLLSGRSQGLVPYLPSPRFNHAIARVQMPGGPVWVDATADQLEFGALPSEDQGVPALVIDDATTDLVSSPVLPADRNRMVDRHEGTLGADEKLTGKMQIEASGDWGWMLRSVLRLVPEGSRDEAVRQMAAEIVENAQCEEPRLENLNDPERPLSLSFRYHVDHYSSTAGNFLLVRLPWRYSDMSGLESLLSDSKRESDVEMAMIRGHLLSTVRLELPAGYTPQDLKPEVKGESAWGQYRVRYRMEGNTLHGERELKLTPLRVPAAEFPRFLEFLRAVDQETRRQLVLKKSEPGN